LVQSRKNVRFSGPDKIRLDINHADIKARTDAIRAVLKELSPSKQTTKGTA